MSIPVHNTAASSPLTSLIESFAAAVPNSLAVPSDLSAIPNSDASFPMPTAAAIEPLMGNHPSTGLIMDAYNAIEPWVAWGVDLAAWAIGWVPWVGLLSYPIRVVYYTGEPIVESLFQVAQDVVKLNFSNIPSALVDGVVQAATNFIYQIAPPLPPGFPSLPFSASNIALASTSTGLTAGPAAALSGRALTLPNGSNLADFGKKITEGIQDLVDRSALKNLTSGDPLSLSGVQVKVAKDEIKPTVAIESTQVAIESAQIDETDDTTPPPAVVTENGRPSLRGAGPLQSLRDLKLPTLKGNGTQLGARKTAAEKPAEKEDADSLVAGITPASGAPDVQTDRSAGASINGFAGKPNSIFSGKPKSIIGKPSQNATGTQATPDANETPKDPKPRTSARTDKDGDSPAPKRVRSHSRGH
ncbi:MAG: hypothetical protein U0R77_05720 [Mycolicibacterium insubricum]